MLRCERCDTEHDGSYASGRFCSKKCASTMPPSVAKRIGAQNGDRMKGRPAPNRGKKIAAQSQEAKQKIYANTDARWRTGPWELIPASRRRDRLMLEQSGKCAICSMSQEWMGKYLSFEMDHVSGDRSDNSRTNVRMICPNCHRQTDTWGAKNASPDGKRRMAESGQRKNHEAHH